ncbi:MAG: hypothetical protein ACTS5Y_08380, partial [Pollutimonas bauzanensis]
MRTKRVWPRASLAASARALPCRLPRVFTRANRRAAAHIPAQQVACWENLVVALLTLPFSFPAMAGLDALDWLW